MKNNTSIALIYARVSTKKQDPQSQLIRCKEYCSQKGYTIEKTFEDKFTGGGNFLERPAMRELLDYAKSNIHKEYIVVFDDLKRFARDTKFHIDLRTVFDSLGLTPECLNYNFDNSPEGRFMETIHAAQNELERHQNRRQVIQKQRARLIAGYNAFTAPKGYKKVKDPAHGTIDVPDGTAKHIKTALRKFATGELQTRTDVASFLKDKRVLGKQKAFRYLQTVKDILSNPFYAGFIEYQPWEVERRKGKHKALITEQEHRQICYRLGKTDHFKPVRMNANPLYPLRGLVNCYYCKKKLTACKSRGRWGGLYHKYYCRNKNCPLRTMDGITKSVAKDSLHEQFKKLLQELTPSKEMLCITRKAFEEVVNDEISTAKKHQQENTRQQEQYEVEINQLIGLLSNPDISNILKERYEKKVEELHQKILEIKVTTSKTLETNESYRTPFQQLFKILKNPYSIWENSDYEQQQRLFYFLFEEHLEYQPEVGFRTPKKALPIRLFEQFEDAQADYVKILRKSSNPIRSYLLQLQEQMSAINITENQ